jgi:hypothetical protein
MAAPRKLRDYAAAVNQLTAAIDSSSDLAGGCGQLERRRQQVVDAAAALPDRYPALGRYEQAALKALFKGLTALAAERHARDHAWLHLVTDLLDVAKAMVEVAPAGAMAWLQQQGGSRLVHRTRNQQSA